MQPSLVKEIHIFYSAIGLKLIFFTMVRKLSFLINSYLKMCDYLKRALTSWGGNQ